MVHQTTVRVYYEDTDLAGIVYYANHLKFLERGRTEALRALGIEQSRLKAETGIVFVVTRLEIDYRRPARFDDLLAVTTALASRGRARVGMAQTIRRDAEVIAAARVMLASIGADGRPVALPPHLRDALDRLAPEE